MVFRETALCLCVISVLLTACIGSNVGSNDSSSGMKAVADLSVDATGTIQLNGRTVTLTELREQLTTLKSQGGSVRYSRANPAGDPPPNAMEALQVVVDLGLPVELVGAPPG